MPFAPGTRLGPFEILAPLATAGLGEVYRVRDHEHDREAAMRVLPADFGGDPAPLKRFEQEARAAALLSHPNILVVHDVGTDAGAAYVISEPIDGRTLREVLKGGALPVQTVIQYAVQIAHGLTAAHEQGIIHRDLKPENILVAVDGRVRVVGFGLAAVTQAESALAGLKGASPGATQGAPGYMSPEQVRGVPPDPRSDMFTFGAIVYEMLTGTRAFSGDAPLETMTAVAKSEPPKQPLAALQLPPALARTIDLCLKKNPGARPAAGDVLRVLHDLWQQAAAPPAPGRPAPAAAPPPQPPASAAPDVQVRQPEPDLPVAPPAADDRAPTFAAPVAATPRRRLVPILVVIGVMLVVALLVPGVRRMLLPAQPGTAGESPSIPPAAPAATATEPDRPVATPAEPARPVAVTDPAQSRLVWFDRSGTEAGAVGAPADYGDLSLSPDGGRVAVSVRGAGSDQGDIVVIDVASGTPTPITSDPADDATPVWSPDGRRLLFASTRTGSRDVYQQDASGTGNAVAVVDGGGDQIAYDWSSDGRWLLYQSNEPGVAQGGNFDLWARPLPGGRPFAFFSSIREATRPKISPDRRWVAYTSVEAGREDVYLAQFPRYGGRRLISARGGSWPRWRRDGTELFYVDPAGMLIAVPMKDGEAGQATPLFQLRAKADRGYPYDVSADGQRTLVNTSNAPASAPGR